MRVSISDDAPEKFLMKSDRGKDVRQQGEGSLEGAARVKQGTGSAEVMASIMEGEESPGALEKMAKVIGLVVQFLTLAIEREMREAAEDEDERQHEEQYPGYEIEVWYYTDDFISKWT